MDFNKNYKRFSLSVAESCTSGTLASLITNTKGASDYFKGGIIAYNNDVKIQLLNVKQTTLEQNTVYSKECVIEMAKGVKQLFQSECAIATSGNLESPYICFYCIIIKDFIYTDELLILQNMQDNTREFKKKLFSKTIYELYKKIQCLKSL